MKCRYCFKGSLDKSLVSGKIVICDFPDDDSDERTMDVATLVEAEAAGVIFEDVGQIKFPNLQPLPTALILPGYFQDVLDYLNSSRYFSCFSI